MEFGVPESLAPPVGLGLPLVELAVAALLLPASTAAWAALAATGLLAAFSVAITRSMATGKAPDCHCFGQLHSEPAGRETLLRNLGLGAAAVFVLAAGWNDPGASAVAWLGDLHGAGIAAAVAVAASLATALAVGYLHRANRRLKLRLDRLEEGTPAHGLPLLAAAPSLSLRDLSGTKRTLADLLAAGRPTMLVFADPACRPCDGILSDVARWQREQRDRLTASVLSSGAPAEVQAKAVEHGLELVLLDRRKKAFRAYDAAGTPSAVLVTPAGRIDSPMVAGPRAIHELVEERFGITTPGGLPLGSELPDLTLRELDGGDVDLPSIRGRETVLLFWDPKSDECRALRDDLSAWELERDDEPALVVISGAEPDALREEGFESTVLLDVGAEAAYAFGGLEPPTAVLVDAGGRVAWPLAGGAEHILRLLRSRSPTAVSA